MKNKKRIRNSYIHLNSNIKNQIDQKEDLIDRLDRILEWIKACDTKSSILLAGIGLVLTIFSSEQCLKKYQQILIYTLKNGKL